MKDWGMLLEEVLTREYILYSLEDYGQLSKQFSDYIGSPELMGARGVQAARESQLKAQVESMRLEGKNIDQVLSFWEELGQETALDFIMSQVAQTLDAKIQSTWASIIANFEGAIGEAHATKKIFLSKDVEAEKLNDFFIAIEKGITALVGQNNVPLSVFAALTNMGASLTGNKKFKYISQQSEKVVPQPITKDQLKTVNAVIRYLQNAVNRHKEKGGLSLKSITSTLNNIFGGALGESISTQLLQSAMPSIEEAFMNINKKTVTNPNVRLISFSNDFSNIGSLQKKGGGTTKIDILNTNALALEVQIGDTVVNISLSTNASVKWLDRGTGDAPKEDFNVSLGSMTLGAIFSGKMGVWTGNRGVAYNIITHDDKEGANLKKLRSSIAASFLNEYLTGSNSMLAKREAVDKVQLFMVNGRVYSVMDIIKKSLSKEGFGSDGLSKYLNMGIPSLQNSWKGKEINWEDAYSRSYQVKKTINKIRVSLHLNMNMFI